MSTYVLSDEEQEIVDVGDAARILLDNSAFLTAIEAVRAQCAESILTSDPQAREGREDAYNLSRGLSAITVELAALAARAEAILAQADAQTADDHPEDVVPGDY